MDIKKVKQMSLEGKQSVIGPGSDSKALYSADYDLQDLISKDSSDITVREHILELFQVKFEQVRKDPNISIVDFKVEVSEGVDESKVEQGLVRFPFDEGTNRACR